MESRANGEDVPVAVKTMTRKQFYLSDTSNEDPMVYKDGSREAEVESQLTLSDLKEGLLGHLLGNILGNASFAKVYSIEHELA